jgi:hypothetical protein
MNKYILPVAVSLAGAVVGASWGENMNQQSDANARQDLESLIPCERGEREIIRESSGFLSCAGVTLEEVTGVVEIGSKIQIDWQATRERIETELDDDFIRYYIDTLTTAIGGCVGIMSVLGVRVLRQRLRSLSEVDEEIASLDDKSVV